MFSIILYVIWGYRINIIDRGWWWFIEWIVYFFGDYLFIFFDLLWLVKIIILEFSKFFDLKNNGEEDVDVDNDNSKWWKLFEILYLFIL